MGNEENRAETAFSGAVDVFGQNLRSFNIYRVVHSDFSNYLHQKTGFARHPVKGKYH